MVVVAVAVTATSIWILYQAAFEEERARLIEAAKSHVQLIEAVARFESRITKNDRPSELTAAVLARIADAHEHYRGFGKTGEFVMARRDGDRIVFLWEQRRFGLDRPQPVPWDAAPAEPMRRALMQMSGVVIGPDYRGVTVLAAYEPVALLGVGIVAKIDMSEIRAPFIEAGAMSFFGALLITLLGLVLFSRVTGSLLESEVRFRNLVEGSIQGVIVHRDFEVLFANQAIVEILGYASAEDVLGLDSLLDIFPPEEHALVRNNRDARMRGDKGVPVLFEIQGVRRDGSLIWLEIRLSVIKWRREPAIQGTYVDITERKQAEQALRESEARLRDAIESMPASFLLFDAEDRLVMYNRKTLEMMPWQRGILKLGVRYEDILRNAVETGNLATPPEGKEEWIERRLQRHRDPGAPVEGERRDGLWVSTFERKTSEGGTVSIRLDITERRRAQGALKESEENFRNLIEGSIQGVCILAPDRRLLFVNQAYADIFGYDSPADILALGTTERLTAPHEQERLIGYRKARLRGDSAPENFEYDGVRKDGTVFRVQTMPRRVVWRGQDAVQVTLFDVTERRRAEQTLYEVIDSLQEGFALYDPDDCLVICNDEYKRLHPAAQDLIAPGMRFRDMVHKTAENGSFANVRGSAEEIVRARMDMHHDPKGPFMRELDDGTRYVVKETRTPEGGFFVTVMDITELARAEEKLRQSQKMEAVGQLTGGIAHDFNNLLGVIIGNLDILGEQLQGDDNLLELVEAATNSALGGAELNRQLLAFSRRQPLDPRVIDLNAQLSGMLDMLRRTLGETITVEAVCAEGLWSCDVDPAQVESALLNLAINARDAMPAGGRLTVETANVMVDDDDVARQGELTPGPYVRLTVADTGAGMAPDDLQRAFEPFFTTKGVGEGSGLGLSMVFGFAKQSGGHAAIESSEGKGTTVTLYLPRAQRPAAAVSRSDAAPAARGEIIFVVEDDPALRKLTVTQLGDLGYDVIEAEDGKTALSVMEETPGVNLLLTDVVLPGGISGPALAEEVVLRHPSTKTLFMSGYARDTVARHGRSDGNFLLLQKPFRKSDLAQKVRAALVE